MYRNGMKCRHTRVVALTVAATRESGSQVLFGPGKLFEYGSEGENPPPERVQPTRADVDG